MTGHGARLGQLVWAGLIAALAAGCLGPTTNNRALTEQQALDAAWSALEPNTASHDRANWQAATVEQVQGRDVADQFDGEPAPGCPGPEPPPNGQIDSGATYWHVILRPAPATARPEPGTPSPTAPPLIPEPFVREGRFLLDPADGSVAARRLSCVLY